MKRKFYQLQEGSFSEFGVDNVRDLWSKVKAAGFNALSKSVELSLTKASDKGDMYHGIFSTDSEDRHGDIVLQDFDLKSFKKNPVFLDSHNYHSIEFIIGKVHNISTKTGKLEGDIEFATANPRGQLAKDLADGGFLNTTSIGFIPKEFDNKGRMLKSELLEISGVSVPAQAEALLDHKGIESDMVDHVVTEEDLANNPTLAEDGVKVGDTIQLPTPAQAPQEGEEGYAPPAPDITPEDATTDPVAPVVAPEDAKSVIARNILAAASRQEETAKRIARAVDQLGKEIRTQKGHEIRRDILKSLRSLL